MQGKIRSKAAQLHEEIFPSQDIGLYKVKKIIGRGTYGYVAKTVHKKLPGFFAIKKISVINTAPEIKRILRQIILLKSCMHPNIVNLIDIMIPKNQTLLNFTILYLVTQYCEGDLYKLFKQDFYLEMGQVCKITYKILCGLKYLHQNNILHRDLKPANILINNDTQIVKICDFGLSRSIEDNIQKQKEMEKQVKKEEISPENSESSCDQTEINQELSEQLSKMMPTRKLPLNKPSLLIKKEDRPQKKEDRPQKKEDRPQKIKTEPLKTLPAKSLTAKVITRWYRAPQVILIMRNYSKPVDIWSFGCIFGEILKMLKECCFDFVQRFPLFPGKYCYPLSPQSKNESRSNDQLHMILTALGKPQQSQMDFLEEWAKGIVRSLQIPKKKTFRQIYPPYIGEQAIEVLEKSLKFNPKQRSSVEELLKLKFFSSVRQQSIELGYKQIKDIDQRFEDQNVTAQQLRVYIKAQIEEFWSRIKSQN